MFSAFKTNPKLGSSAAIRVAERKFQKILKCLEATDLLRLKGYQEEKRPRFRHRGRVSPTQATHSHCSFINICLGQRHLQKSVYLSQNP